MDHAAVFSATPSNRLLGSRLVQRSQKRCELELPVRGDLAPQISRLLAE